MAKTTLEQYLRELEKWCDEAMPLDSSESAMLASVAAQANLLIETPKLLRIVRELVDLPLVLAECVQVSDMQDIAERIINEPDAAQTEKGRNNE
jgi:hypothetical protein